MLIVINNKQFLIISIAYSGIGIILKILKQRFIIVALFSILSITCSAREYFSKNNPPDYNFSPLSIETYQLVTSLRFSEAYENLKLLRQKDPKNLTSVYIEDYIDFLALVISEDQSLYNKLYRNKEIRLNKLKNGSVNSPYYYYFQAEVYLHWGAIQIKFGNYISALSDTYKAFNLLEKNKKSFPDFILNNKSLGILHAIIGTIPSSYRNGLRLISGMDGTIEQGLAEINKVLEYTDKYHIIFANETRVIYTFLLLHLANQPDDAWQKLSTGNMKYDNNPLLAYVYANVAYHSGRNDEVIQILQKRPTDKKYFPFWLSDLLLARAKLNHLDKDAIFYIDRFLQNYKGKSYIKEAYLMAAWYYAIFNDPVKSQNNLNLVKSLGNDELETDKAALKEAKLGHLSPINLLKARLLFDGAYGQKALEVLEASSINNFSGKEYKLEYLYRLARIHQLQNHKKESIDQYLKVINFGAKDPYYYACNAALQLGIIYEIDKQCAEAKKYYKMCLNFDPDDYANSLHTRAKSGIQRCK